MSVFHEPDTNKLFPHELFFTPRHKVFPMSGLYESENTLFPIRISNEPLKKLVSHERAALINTVSQERFATNLIKKKALAFTFAFKQQYIRDVVEYGRCPRP